jgi:hypothetical protein
VPAGTTVAVYQLEVVSEPEMRPPRSLFFQWPLGELSKEKLVVMPDLIRHPELVQMTGFRLSPE